MAPAIRFAWADATNNCASDATPTVTTAVATRTSMSEKPAAFKGCRISSQRQVQVASRAPAQWNQEDPGDETGDASGWSR